MPTAYIKKLAGEGKGSVSSLEKKWDEAKAKAHGEGKGSNYAYITSIFKNMVGASVELNAASRILATSDLTAHNALAYLSSLGLTFKGTPRIQETSHDRTKFFSFDIPQEDYDLARSHLSTKFGKPHEKTQWQIDHSREVGLMAFKEDGTRSIYVKETD